MNTFAPGPGSIPRRLLFQVGSSIPGRLLSQGGSIPGSPLEGTGRETWVPIPPASQPTARADSNVLVVMAAVICSMLTAASFFTMLRWCALHCNDGILGSPEAEERRRCNTGMRKAAIRALPTVIYYKDLQPPEAGTDCPICLAEFQDGETLRALPHCNHCFHMECIDRWFRSHSSCPTCRNCLLIKARAKPATPSTDSRSAQESESSGMQTPPAECAVQVATPACQGDGDGDGESPKDGRSGMGWWNSGKARTDAACGIGR